MSRRILITGALGTLGWPLFQALTNKGYNVFGIDALHSSKEKIARCDIREYRQLEFWFNEICPDYVYHLAAEFGRHNGEDYYENLWSTNVIGTKNILRLQDRLGFNLIFASSSEVYGDIAANPLKETDIFDYAVSHPNDYAMTKWVNEQQIRNRSNSGLDSMILRFFNAYGPGEYYTSYRSVVCLFCYRLLHELPIAVYKNYKRCFMFIDDFIETLAGVCDRFHPGEIVNIAGSEHRDVADVLDIAERHMASLGMFSKSEIAWIDEEEHNRRSKDADISVAIDLLGHQPVTRLEEGIPKTLDWMRKCYLGHTDC